jgi:thiaminase
MSFSQDQLARVEPLWRRMLAHPFLLQTRDGTIPDQTFARWMQQDYLFVEAALSFLAALLARAPRRRREPLADAIVALRTELRLFEDQATKAGVRLDEAAPAFVNHAYMQFLMATALGRSYPEAYTVLYAAEKAYHDSWGVVQQGLSPDSRWSRLWTTGLERRSPPTWPTFSRTSMRSPSRPGRPSGRPWPSCWRSPSATRSPSGTWPSVVRAGRESPGWREAAAGKPGRPQR